MQCVFAPDIICLLLNLCVIFDVLLLGLHMLVVALLQLPLHTLVEG